MLHLSLLLFIVAPPLCHGSFIDSIVNGLIPGDNSDRIPEDDNFDLSVYHPFDEIICHLNVIQGRYSDIVKIKQIGTTFENNPITGLKIGSTSSKIGSKIKSKPAIWIDSCIHAREWITPATSLYIIDQLLKGYDTDKDIRQLLDTYDWYIFPVLNPDGYKYSWSAEDRRLWRKNKSYHSENCRGTDLNRNFGVGFEDSGNSSTDPCSNYYRGTSPFSERESRAVRDGILKLAKRLKLVITLHAYGQLWMSPYGYTLKLPKDHEDHMKVLNVAVSTIKNVSGEIYTPGTISEVKYLAPGASTDWVYKEANVTYSFAVEVRDTGKYGYVLPPELILPTAKEIFPSIIAVASYIAPLI